MNADEALSKLEYHVLLALADRALYGYALKQAIEAESTGALRPRAGSMYRVLARMMARSYVEETSPDEPPEPHPGRERKYYALTGEGREALRFEAARLRKAAVLAEARLDLAEQQP